VPPPAAAPPPQPAAPAPQAALVPLPAPVVAPPPPAPAPLAEAPAPAQRAEAKPPKPKPKTPEPSAHRARYAVQAGSFVSEQIAGKVASRLTDHDHPAEVVQRTDNTGRTWNVVRLTEVFASHDEAVRTSDALKRNEEVDTLVIRLAPESTEDKPKPQDAPKPGDKTGAEPPP
jgi:cell division protein FtsN